MKDFGIEYWMDGAWYLDTIEAEDHEDAERRLSCIQRRAFVIGERVASIPFDEPNPENREKPDEQ